MELSRLQSLKNNPKRLSLSKQIHLFVLSFLFIVSSCNKITVDINDSFTKAAPSPFTPQVTINQATTQTIGSCNFTAAANATTSAGFEYHVFFTNPIDPSTFDVTDIVNTGTGGDTTLTWTLQNCGDNQNYQLVATTVDGDGTIVPTLPAGSVQTPEGVTNTASTSTDNIVSFDTTDPTLTINQAVTQTVGSCSFTAASDPTNTSGFSYRVTFSEGINPTTFTNADITNAGSGGVTTLTWSITSCGDNRNFRLTASAVVGDGTIIPEIGASAVQDLAGNFNEASTATDNSVTLETSQPSVTIEQALTEVVGTCNFTAPSDPSNVVGFSYRVSFSEPINPASFVAGDITNSGTGGGGLLTWSITNCGDNTNFRLTANAITGNGSIVPNLASGRVQDLAGNSNTVSTSTDNSVTYDASAPSLTINQAVTQTVGSCNFTAASDPTTTAGFSYRVTFSEAINDSTFTTADITNTGTGGSTLTWSLTNCGDDRNYMLTAATVVGDGTIIPTVAASAVQDSAGNNNSASTATDNSVLFDAQQPTVTINQAIAQTVGSCNFTATNDPSNAVGFSYRVVFSEAINTSSFDTGDITNAGTGGLTTLTWSLTNCGDNTNFRLTASAISGNGTIVPNIAAGVVQDVAGNTNLVSTSSDNSVTFDGTAPGVTIDQAATEIVGTCNFTAANDPTNAAGFSYKVTFTEEINASTFAIGDITNAGTGGGTLLTWSLANCGDNTNFMLTASAVDGNGPIIPNIASGRVQDLAGNNNTVSTATDNSVTYNNTQPSVTINQAVVGTVGTCTFATAPDPTNTAGFEYRVTFTMPIDDSTFTAGDISNAGAGGGTTLTWAITNCGDDRNFKLTASAVVGDGPIRPTLAAGVVQDVALNNNNASTSTDNTVLFDTEAPEITINQATLETIGSCTFVAPNDPTSTPGFEFKVEMSEAINPTTFVIGDIANAGTGGATTLTWGITNCGDNTTFKITASAVTGDGTIIPSISASAVQDLAGNNNNASMSGDGSVTYDSIQPSVTIEQAITETVGSCNFLNADDPANSVGFSYRVTTSEPINTSTLTISDFTNSGSGGGIALLWSLTNCGDDTNFMLTSLVATGEGTIAPNLAAGTFEDRAGNPNDASTSTDNTISYDAVSPNVTINQAVAATVGTCTFTAAADPTADPGFEYRVTFSEAIDDSTFTTADITNSGTGGTTTLTWALDNCGDDTNFKLTATAVDGYGTIIPTLGAGVVEDNTGNANFASTATDNTITFKFLGWYQEAYIKVGNAEGYDEIGTSISLNGDTLVVGKKFDNSSQSTITNGPTSSSDTAATRSGAAFVYKRTGGTWIQEAYIKAVNNNNVGGDFGNSVSISRDTLAVAAWIENSSQNTITNGGTASFDTAYGFSGAVYIYKRSGTNWQQEAYIKASNNNGYHYYFGTNVSLSGDTLAVGSSGESSGQTTITNGTSAALDTDADYSGAVYIYERIGTIWSQQAYIKASNAEDGEEFGTYLSLHDDTLVVGVTNEDSNQTTITNGATSSSNNSNDDSGAVYVYKRTGVNWAQEAYIKAENNEAYDYFGGSVSISGDTLAVGAVGEDSNLNIITNGTTASADNSNEDSGSVYVYKRAGTTWQQEAFIKAANNDPYDNFGTSVALNGDTLTVGAIYEESNQTTITNGSTASSDNSNYGSGAVYVYKRTGSSWAQEAYIKASNNDPDDSFGLTVALSGDTIAVGATGEDSNQTTITNGDTASADNSFDSSGAIYVYRNNKRLFDISDASSSFALTSVTLNWPKTGGSATGYVIAYQVGTTAPADCSQGTVINVGDVDSYNVTGLTTGVTYSFRICASDGSSFNSGTVVTTTPSDPTPPAVTINQAVTETVGSCSFTATSEPTNNPGFSYRVTFSMPINEASFTPDDITNSGTGGAAGITWAIVNCGDDTNFKLTATTVSGSGTIIPEISAGKVQRNNSIFNTDSTATDNSVEYLELGWYQEAYIKASNSEEYDEFGYTISLDGETLAIGVSGEDSSQTTITNGVASSADNSSADSGAVYIYKRTGVTWQQEAYVKAANNDISDFFGGHVSLSGDTLAVGAYSEDSNQTTITNGINASADNSNSTSGAVYIYKRTGVTWQQEAYVKAINSDSGDFFGANVSLAKDILAVGAPIESSNQNTITNGSSASSDNSSQYAGAVYIYKRTGSTWQQEAYIKASNNDPWDAFGERISLNGDSLAVSSWAESSNETTITNGTTASSDNSNNSSGAVYVYKRTGTTWQQEAYVKAANNDPDDNFGYSVSLSGDSLAVGAPYEDSNQTSITNGTTASSDNSNESSGAVYVYKRTGTTWQQEAYIKAVNSNADDNFGYNISLKGDTLAVGSYQESSNQTIITNGTTASANNSSEYSGAVYVYKRTGTTWQQEAYLKASNSDQWDNFGQSVSISGDTLAVGSNGESSNQTTITNGATSSSDNSNSYSGAVYVYRNNKRLFEVMDTSFSYDTNSITLNWYKTGGIATGYIIAYQSGSTPPATCSAGTVLNVGNVNSYEVTGLTTGVTYSFRICATDGTTTTQGNMALVTATPNAPLYIAIEQAVAETVGSCTFTTTADPSNAPGFAYKATFSSAINGASFTSADITNPGTGGNVYIRWTIQSCGDNRNYKLIASEIVGDGTILPTVSAGSVLAVSGVSNRDSTSTDNAVTFLELGWKQEAYIKAVNAEASDYFGYQASIWGDTLAVGAPEEDNNQTTITNGATVVSNNFKSNSGAVYVYKRSGATWVQEAYIKAVNSELNDGFGFSVYLHNDTLAVGAQEEDAADTSITNGPTATMTNGLSASGAVYVYKRTGVNWIQEAYIKASNAGSQDNFGGQVAIHGNTLVVSAVGEDSDQTTITNGSAAPSTNNFNSSSGAVYVYRRTGSNWAQEAVIKASNNNIDDKFGESISIDGDTIVVGAKFEGSNETSITNGATASTDNSAFRAGAAYVYKRTGTTWEQEAYIKSVNSEAGDNFGSSVSLSGDTLAVGAYGESSNQTTITNGSSASADNSKSDSGAVYIYKRTAGVWTQEAYIKASNAGDTDLFGYQHGLALDGDTLAVGTYAEDSNQITITNGPGASSNDSNDGAGAVYVFKRSGTSWIQEAYIKAINNDASDWFSRVSLSGDSLAVGAYWEDSNQTTITNGQSASADNSSTNAGAVYVYRNNARLFEIADASYSYDSTSVTLNWPKTGGTATGYVIAYQTGTTAPANCSSGTVLNVGNVSSYQVSGLTTGIVYSFRICATDGTSFTHGNYSIITAVPENIVAPSVTINQSVLESVGSCLFTATTDPSSTAGFSYRVTFSKVINAATFTTADITNSGTGGATTLAWTLNSCGDNRNFMLTASSITGLGTIIPELNAGKVFGFNGDANLASTATDNSVTYGETGWKQEAYIKAANNDVEDWFGSSISLNGETLAVGAPSEDSVQNTITNGTSASSDDTSAESGAVYVYKRTGSNWTQEAYIKAINSETFDGFGYSVSLNGDTLAVGAPYESSNQTTITNGATASSDNTNLFSGAVYVYKRAGATWQQEAYIKAVNNESGDWFGSSVSVNGDTLAVGSPVESSGETTITNGTTAGVDNTIATSGAVFVYKRTGSTWQQEAYIKASNNDSIGEWFGANISLNGDSLAVGVYGEDSNENTITNGATASSDNSKANSGAVYVYKRTGTTWQQEAYIKAVNSDTGDIFGNHVSLVGDTLVVGAKGEASNENTITNGATASSDNSNAFAGAVYVYKRTGTTWQQEAFIKAANSDAVDNFGIVTLSGNTIAVGAPGECSDQVTITNGTSASLDNTNTESGAVYIYKRTGTSWQQEAYVKASNNRTGDSFGLSVSLSGDTLAVSTPYEDSNETTITNGTTASTDTSSSESGAVYIYRSNARLFEVNDIWATSDASSVTLKWNKTGGSATGYIVTYQVGTTAPADCTQGTDIDVGDVDTHLESGLSSATTYSFRVCATDGVGMTAGWTRTVTTQ